MLKLCERLMLYFMIKTIISAVLIALISVVAKRYAFWGAVLASIPLISVLAILWLYVDTKNTMQIAKLSYDIFWLVLPSLLFFLTLPILLKHHVHFYLSVLVSLVVMIAAYFVMGYCLKKFGVA